MTAPKYLFVRNAPLPSTQKHTHSLFHKHYPTGNTQPHARKQTHVNPQAAHAHKHKGHNEKHSNLFPSLASAVGMLPLYTKPEERERQTIAVTRNSGRRRSSCPLITLSDRAWQLRKHEPRVQVKILLFPTHTSTLSSRAGPGRRSYNLSAAFRGLEPAP